MYAESVGALRAENQWEDGRRVRDHVALPKIVAITNKENYHEYALTEFVVLGSGSPSTWRLFAALAERRACSLLLDIGFWVAKLNLGP